MHIELPPLLGPQRTLLILRVNFVQEHARNLRVALSQEALPWLQP